MKTITLSEVEFAEIEKLRREATREYTQGVTDQAEGSMLRAAMRYSRAFQLASMALKWADLDQSDTVGAVGEGNMPEGILLL